MRLRRAIRVSLAGAAHLSSQKRSATEEMKGATFRATENATRREQRRRITYFFLCALCDRGDLCASDFPKFPKISHLEKRETCQQTL
jgi:hypothetical protein